MFTNTQYFTGFTTSIHGRKLFTNTQYVHRVHNQHTGKKDVHKHTIIMFTVNKPAYREERCSQTHNMFTGFTTSIHGRKLFTSTQYVHSVHNQHTGKKNVNSQTHNMFTGFTTSIQGRKMFTNTQYVHTVHKTSM